MSQMSVVFEKVMTILRTPGEQRKFLTGAASVFIIQIAGVGSAYVLQVLLARWMGAEPFGDYIYAYNWARLLAAFGGVGLTLSVLKFLPDYIAEKDWGRLRGLINAFSTIVFGASSLLAAGALLLFIAFPPQDVDATTLYIGLLTTPLFALTLLFVEMIRGMGHVRLAYTPLSFGQNALMIVAAGLTLLLTGTLTNVIAISLLGGVTLGIVVFQVITILRKLPIVARGAKAVYEVKHWLRTSFPMLLIQSFDIIMDRVDVLIVGLVLGAVPTAIYAVASRSAALAIFPLVAVNSMTAQRISPLYNAGRMGELSQLVKRATALSIVGTLVICAGLIVLSYPLLFIFGEEFVVGQRTLIILVIGQFMNAATGPVSYLLSMTGHQKVNGRIYGIVLAVNITLNLSFLTFTDLGIEGVAIATASAIALRNVILYFEVRRRLNISTLPFIGGTRKNDEEGDSNDSA